MRNTTRTAIAAAAVVAAVVSLSACGTTASSKGAPYAPTATSAVGAAPEVSFADGILPLESQYTALVDIAQTRGGGPGVRDMAALMASHTEDMAGMRARMQAWGRPVPSPGYPATLGPGMMRSGMPGRGMPGPGMMTGATPGMMSGGWGDQRLWCRPGAPTNLSGLTGSAFDARWIDAARAVMRAEIVLCQAELRNGSDPATRALAQRMMADRMAVLASPAS